MNDTQAARDKARLLSEIEARHAVIEDRDEWKARAAALEARVVAAEAERDELRDACHLTAKSAERRLERAEAAEGRLQAALEIPQLAPIVMAEIKRLIGEGSYDAAVATAEEFAKAARAVLVGEDAGGAS